MSTKSKSAVPVSRSRRTGVIFPGALGDFICFLPALTKLTESSSVEIFAQSQFDDIVPAQVAVRSLERSEISKLFIAEPAQDEVLRDFFDAYDAVYSWLGSRNQSFVRRLQALTSGRAQIFSLSPETYEGHQVDYYLSCINRVGDGPRQPTIELRQSAIHWREAFWADHALDQYPVLAIAPGSGAREKNWPAEFFFGIVQWWRMKVRGRIVLVVGPVEKERGGIQGLRSSCLIVEDLRLSQAAALLERCTVYLGNDSGMSHLAAALGVRTVALFGPSDPKQWAPRGDKVSVVRRHLSCSPCSRPILKSCSHRACLRELYPDDVSDAMATLPEVLTLTRSEAGIKV